MWRLDVVLAEAAVTVRWCRFTHFNACSPFTQALMSAPGIQLILATGGPALVKAAYSSGHPSIGVGAGNVPAIIDSSADLQQAISSIMCVSRQ